MPAVDVVLSAEGFALHATTAADAESRIADDKWPEPKPKPNAVEGAEGSVQVDVADYDDRTITLKLDTTNPAGELGTRPWVQQWEQVAAAATRDKAATLTSTFSNGVELIYDVITAHFEAALGHEHWLGYGAGELTLVCKPFGRKPQRTVPGTTTPTAVGGMPVWRADEPLDGDVPALLEVTGTWADRRRDVSAILCAAPPVALDPARVMTTWNSVDLGGESVGVTSIIGQAPRDPAPVAKWTAPLTGNCAIDVRLRASTANASERVGLAVDGTVVAWTTIEAHPPGEVGVLQWRVASFGDIDVNVGSAVQLLAGSDYGPTLVVDIATFSPQPVAAAIVAPASTDIPFDALSGDDIPAAGSGSLDGRTALFGGTWAAAGWSYEENATHGPSATGTGVASLSTTATLSGAVVSCAAELTAKFMHQVPEVGLVATTGTAKVVVAGPSSRFLELRVNDGTNSIVRPIPIVGTGTTIVDVRLQVDADGRVVVSGALRGGRKRELARIHVPGLAGKTFRAQAKGGGATPGLIRLYSLRLLQGSRLPYSTTVRWAADSGGALVRGPFPAAKPGERPYVFVRAAATGLDSPAVPHPTAIAVAATERYLQVPE